MLKNILLVVLIFPITFVAALRDSSKTDSFDQHGVLPLTSEEVSQYLRQAQDNLLQSVDALLSIPDHQKTSENILRRWNHLNSELLGNFSVLTFLTQTEFPSKGYAAQAIAELQAFIFKVLVQNGKLSHFLMTCSKEMILQDTSLTPYERHEIQHLLDSYENIKDRLTKEEQRTISQLKEINAKHDSNPFIYLESATPSKATLQDNTPKQLTILTLNTCFVPGNFPYLYGGVIQPWQKRVLPLAKKILETHADVICLQEVHEEEASLALYEALKNEYTYFYGAMGPRVLGFSLNTLGRPSGLFVASKYPIENPQFTRFAETGFPMNYGFFDFTITDGTTALGHIYTTHMQSLNWDQFAQIRALQLEQILEKMHEDLDRTIPFFLCGDLNIPYGSKEPAEALVCKHFHNDYNKDQSEINKNNRTCTDYFTNWFFSSTKDPESIDPNFQIIDYALLLRSLPFSPETLVCQEYDIKTVLVPMNDLSKPESAVSDHHALLTTIQPKHL
ncbi:MAG: endonuclease/exonuclease/phosphatase family protein [Simkania sp.]|nr:endonuclease/exonuclease/phosphatase family protein [Simkania sp.]